MISLQPREQKANDLPEPVSTVVLVNETMARMDLEAQVENGILTVKVLGLYLGKPVEAPFEGAKPVWKLG
jgi:hypothetical protein